MRGFTYAAVFAGMFYGVIAGGATAADAARCKQGQVYRPSIGVCQSKATAARQGVRSKRYARASIKHRYKRPPLKRASMQKVHRIEEEIGPVKAPPPTPPWRQPIPALNCDELCQLQIALPLWVARNKDSFR
jgi:hypothetical protein